MLKKVLHNLKAHWKKWAFCLGISLLGAACLYYAEVQTKKITEVFYTYPEEVKQEKNKVLPVEKTAKALDSQKLLAKLLDNFPNSYVLEKSGYLYFQIDSQGFLNSFNPSEQGLSLAQVCEERLQKILSPDYSLSIAHNSLSLSWQNPVLPFVLVLDFSKLSPRMTIVIDDLGEKLSILDKIKSLSFPVTLSILPDNPEAAELAKAAYLAGYEVFLHQAMQPMSVSAQAKNSLTVGMSLEEIKVIVEKNIGKLLYINGINNHTGSQFTSDPQAISRFLQVMENYPHLILFDSLTHPKSVFYSQAEKLPNQRYYRDIFLDNDLDVQLILNQLNKCEELALKKGIAIAIGHPHKETMQALSNWQAKQAILVPMWQLKYTN